MAKLHIKMQILTLRLRCFLYKDLHLRDDQVSQVLDSNVTIKPINEDTIKKESRRKTIPAAAKQ